MFSLSSCAHSLITYFGMPVRGRIIILYNTRTVYCLAAPRPFHSQPTRVISLCALPPRVSADGKNDGSVKGDRYFQCPPGHGLFVTVNKLKPAVDV